MPKTKKSRVSRKPSPFAELELFRGFPAAGLRALENESPVSEVPPNHIFFRPGEPGAGMYLLEAGCVQTFRTSGNKKLIIAELRPPAVFGEMGSVGPCLYHCHAQATEASLVRTIPQARVQLLLDQQPTFARQLLELVSKRFVHVLLDLEATSFRHLIPRLATLLLERSQGDSIEGLTHKEIAEHLRVYRESATAALGELRKAGILSITRKQIRILDRSRLLRASRE